MDPLLLVALGGALGSMARFLVGGALQSGFFPIGTLLINVAGSFILGLIMYGSAAFGLPTDVRIFGGVGLMGGFTTFSAFSYETFKLVENQQWVWAAGYAFLSVGLSLGAVFLARAAVMALRPG